MGVWGRSLKGSNTRWGNSGQAEHWVGCKDRDSVMTNGFSSLTSRKSKEGGGKGRDKNASLQVSQILTTLSYLQFSRHTMLTSYLQFSYSYFCVQSRFHPSPLSCAPGPVKNPGLHPTLAHDLPGLRVSPTRESWISSSEPSLAPTPWNGANINLVSGNFPTA